MLQCCVEPVKLHRLRNWYYYPYFNQPCECNQVMARSGSHINDYICNIVYLSPPPPPVFALQMFFNVFRDTCDLNKIVFQFLWYLQLRMFYALV